MAALKSKTSAGAANRFLNHASTEQAAGQMLTLGFDADRYTRSVGTWYKKYKPGGLILFSRNLTNREQAKTLTNDLQKLSEDVTGLTAFICIDQEGGRVSRLPKDFVLFPTARSLGESGSGEKVYDVYTAIAQTLKDIGVNVDFAPVLDLDTNENNPVIGDRAFGADPDKVSILACSAIAGLKNGGVLTCGKHFPGHGDTSVDSHLELPVDSRPVLRFESAELKPFEMAIDHGVDFMMTAHLVYPAFDEKYPATLSRKIVTGLLRAKLEFQGVIISDDMDMKSIRSGWSDDEAVKLAIGAGVEMILVCHEGKRQETAFDTIRGLIDKGSEAVVKGLDRILKTKFETLE